MVTDSPSTIASGCRAIARPPVLIVVTRWERHPVVNPDDYHDYHHDYHHDDPDNFWGHSKLSPVWKTATNVVFVNWSNSFWSHFSELEIPKFATLKYSSSEFTNSKSLKKWNFRFLKKIGTLSLYPKYRVFFFNWCSPISVPKRKPAKQPYTASLSIRIYRNGISDWLAGSFLGSTS